MLKHDLIPTDVMEAAITAVEARVEDLAQRLKRAGHISSTYSDAGFTERLTLIEGEFPDASVLLHKAGVLPTGIADLWAHPNLLDVRRGGRACVLCAGNSPIP